MVIRVRAVDRIDLVTSSPLIMKFVVFIIPQLFMYYINLFQPVYEKII
jgi:hypothetical protein